jgi:hypothetical protein
MTLAWMLLEKNHSAYIWLGNKLEIVQLLLWPSSLFMLATAGHEDVDYRMLTISTIMNVGLYALIGAATWYGFYKQRWVLLALSALVLAGWYKLLSL